MDISSILPLLMSGGKVDTATIMNLLTKNNSQNEEKSSPDMASVISSVMKNRPTTPRVTMRDVLGFVGDEILGKITKYMENYRA